MTLQNRNVHNLPKTVLKFVEDLEKNAGASVVLFLQYEDDSVIKYTK